MNAFQVFKEISVEEDKEDELTLTEVANDTVGSLFALAQSSARSQTTNDNVGGGSDAETFLTALADAGNRVRDSVNDSSGNTDASAQLDEAASGENTDGQFTLLLDFLCVIF